ncbi:MAG: PilN domain-containing protein [Phycisphaeraceae bacterium]|nr:PilN domain-containing protein [Phycisphaeraceae bacterium]
MRAFLVDLLPRDVRDRVRSQGEKRRFGLLLVLLVSCLVGVSLHSWDQARRARLIREASLVSRDRLDDVDVELRRLEAERQQLGAFMSTYRAVSLPMEKSDLLATIVNVMPIQATLTDLSMRLEERVLPQPANAAPTAPGAPPTSPPKRRVLEIRLRGYAASNAEVTAFERTLAATGPLARVTLGENRSLETPDGNFQEFVITAEVALESIESAPRTLDPIALESSPRRSEARR